MQLDAKIISNILPRYYRLKKKLSLNNSNDDMIYPVEWLPGFVAVPGYLPYDESIGIAMCASSELAVRALGLDDFMLVKSFLLLLILPYLLILIK